MKLLEWVGCVSHVGWIDGPVYLLYIQALVAFVRKRDKRVQAFKVRGYSSVGITVL